MCGEIWNLRTSTKTAGRIHRSGLHAVLRIRPALHRFGCGFHPVRIPGSRWFRHHRVLPFGQGERDPVAHACFLPGHRPVQGRLLGRQHRSRVRRGRASRSIWAPDWVLAPKIISRIYFPVDPGLAWNPEFSNGASSTDYFIDLKWPFHPIPFFTVTPSATWTALLGDAKRSVMLFPTIRSSPARPAISSGACRFCSRSDPEDDL